MTLQSEIRTPAVTTSFQPKGSDVHRSTLVWVTVVAALLAMAAGVFAGHAISSRSTATTVAPATTTTVPENRNQIEGRVGSVAGQPFGTGADAKANHFGATDTVTGSSVPGDVRANVREDRSANAAAPFGAGADAKASHFGATDTVTGSSVSGDVRANVREDRTATGTVHSRLGPVVRPAEPTIEGIPLSDWVAHYQTATALNRQLADPTVMGIPVSVWESQHATTGQQLINGYPSSAYAAHYGSTQPAPSPGPDAQLRARFHGAGA